MVKQLGDDRDKSARGVKRKHMVSGAHVCVGVCVCVCVREREEGGRQTVKDREKETERDRGEIGCEAVFG